MKGLPLLMMATAVMLGSISSSLAALEVPLIAGQDKEVGQVSVWNDGMQIYVMYMLYPEVVADGWCIKETHVHIGESLADFPLTQKGNPKVGHFDYGLMNTCEDIPAPVGIPYTANLLYNPDFTMGDDGKEGWNAFVNMFGDFGWFGFVSDPELAEVGDGCLTLHAFPYDIPDSEGVDWVEYNVYSEYYGMLQPEPPPLAPFNGESVTFSGNLQVAEPFGPDTTGYAFVRTLGFGFWIIDNLTVDAGINGAFSITVNQIPGVYILQVGFATYGPEPAVGALKACNLRMDVANHWISEAPLIAAHAALEKVEEVGLDKDGERIVEIVEESAWAAGTRFVEKGSWATWFMYPIDLPQD